MKNRFLKSTISKKNIFLKRMLLKKNYFWKAGFEKKFCTQKLSFWLNLHRKLRNFCILSAILRSTLSNKKNFLKSMI